MLYRTFTFRVLTLCLLLVLAAAGLQAQERPRRIAVLDFDFDAIQKWWEGDWNVGGGISEILVTTLFEDGTYQLVDRNAIDQIMREQDMTQTDRFDPGAAAQLGKLLGADALLIGSITQFGTEKKSTGGIGGLLGKKSGVIGGVGMKEGKAKCVIDARLIDVNTGVIVAVAEGEGESSRKGLLLGGAGRSGSSAGGGAFQMTSSDFRETILGEATNTACDEVVKQIVANADKIEAAKLEIDGLVADFDAGANEITMTPGREAGVAVGQIFMVKRVTGVVKHPTTGDIIREKTDDVGRVEITEAGDGYAVGKVLDGSTPEAGDKIVIHYEE